MTDSPNKVDFPNLKEGNKTLLSIYVPTTQDIDKKASKQEVNKRVKDTRDFLSRLFGGSSSVKVVGTYISQDRGGKLVKERVMKVSAFANTDEYKKFDTKVRDFIQRKKKEWTQESIGFEFESDANKGIPSLNFI